MGKPNYLISTPENVDLHLELAGIGNRALACLIDTVITYLLMLFVIAVIIAFGLAIENSALARDVKVTTYFYLIGLTVLLLFCINFGYFIYFESAWLGQTPGKKLAHIRVIEANGQPANLSSIFIRNLLRIADQGLAFVGLIVMLVDKHERRFGDLAAGTIVIRERLPELTNLDLKNAYPAEPLIDTGQISGEEYQLLLSFLKRRQLMAASERSGLARDLVNYFSKKLNMSIAENSSFEPILEKIYVAYKGTSSEG